MDNPALLIGALALSFALYTLALRLISPARLGKLALMQEKFGRTQGNIMHSFFYIAIPLLYGSFCLFRAAQGLSILS